MQYKAIAELIVAGPGLSDYKLRVALLHAIEFALENKAPHCAVLEGVGVLDVKILEPEQTFQIVLAAAGEEESPLETWIPLDEGQRARAQEVLGQAFKAFVVGEYLNICLTTGTLVGWVKAHGDWHLLSHTVSKAILRHILGE